jgi:exodeoxyribonuclease VII small subunit
LDESLVLFEEGLLLIKECDGQLKNFEGKVRELMEHYSPKGE